MLTILYLAVTLLSVLHALKGLEAEKFCKNWPSWGNGLENHHTSGNSAINVGNAKDLKLDWMTTVHGNVFTTPTVYDGVVYLVDQAGYVYALHEYTGKVIWEQTLAN